MKKENNSRQYPGETCQHRPDRATERRDAAKDRKDKSDALSPKQRIENLDIKFGVGQGAKKERERLATTTKIVQVKITSSTKSAPVYEELDMTLPDEVMQEIAALNDEGSSKKKLKAKERRARETNNS